MNFETNNDIELIKFMEKNQLKIDIKRKMRKFLIIFYGILIAFLVTLSLFQDDLLNFLCNFVIYLLCCINLVIAIVCLIPSFFLAIKDTISNCQISNEEDNGGASAVYPIAIISFILSGWIMLFTLLYTDFLAKMIIFLIHIFFLIIHYYTKTKVTPIIHFFDNGIIIYSVDKDLTISYKYMSIQSIKKAHIGQYRRDLRKYYKIAFLILGKKMTMKISGTRLNLLLSHFEGYDSNYLEYR